jgi:hypothetical protein
VVYLPILGSSLGTSPLSAGDWALCVTLASAVLWVDELKKLIVRRAERNGGDANDAQ